jgi:hypothetical protein
VRRTGGFVQVGLWNVIERFAMSIVGFLRDRQADILVGNGHSRAKARCCNHSDFAALSLAGKTSNTRFPKIM